MGKTKSGLRINIYFEKHLQWSCSGNSRSGCRCSGYRWTLASRWIAHRISWRFFWPRCLLLSLLLLFLLLSAFSTAVFEPDLWRYIFFWLFSWRILLMRFAICWRATGVYQLINISIFKYRTHDGSLLIKFWTFQSFQINWILIHRIYLNNCGCKFTLPFALFKFIFFKLDICQRFGCRICFHGIDDRNSFIILSAKSGSTKSTSSPKWQETSKNKLKILNPQ